MIMNCNVLSNADAFQDFLRTTKKYQLVIHNNDPTTKSVAIAMLELFDMASNMSRT